MKYGPLNWPITPRVVTERYNKEHKWLFRLSVEIQRKGCRLQFPFVRFMFLIFQGQYSPSYLVCPETYNWIPIEQCLPKFDRTKYARLDDSSEGKNCKPFASLKYNLSLPQFDRSAPQQRKHVVTFAQFEMRSVHRMFRPLVIARPNISIR